jgi:hypothetical protein
VGGSGGERTGYRDQTAELRAAEADAATNPAEKERLRADAAQARALAETLDEQAEKLQVIDDARAHFLADNARTLGYGRRCEAELSRRHIDDTEPEQVVTAEEWLTAHRVAVVEDDQHRAITETDLTGSPAVDDDRAQPVAVGIDDDVVQVPERDIREVAADEPAPANEDLVRIPSPAETADDYAKATRALAEINARRAADQQEEAEHRAAELDRWHVDDQAANDASESAFGYDAHPAPA